MSGRLDTLDTLDTWLRLRPGLSASSMPSSPPSSSSSPPPVGTAVAALRRHIDRRDRPRDPARARHLEEAADLLEATIDDAFDVDHLAAVSARLHGVVGPMPLRTRTAFAKGGRESMRPFRPDELAAVLADAADVGSEQPAWLRAARIYADVCFFHPFDDGNGRLALLALVDVLQRARVSVVDLAPVVMPWTPRTVPSLLRVVRGICR